MSASRTEVAAAIGLVALLAALGSVFGRSQNSPDDPRRSTFVDAPRGLHALHMLLAEVGAHPRRASEPPAASEPVDHTLVLAEPSESLTRRETAELVEWVDAGGRLVVVAGVPMDAVLGGGANALLAKFGVTMRPGAVPTGAGVRVLDAAAARDMHGVEWRPAASVEAADAVAPVTIETLATAAGACVAGRIARGENGGELVVLADAGLLENDSLGRGDNAVFAVRVLLARASDEGRVVFDEYHHGFGDTGSRDHVVAVMLAMVHGTWPGRALLVIALAGLVWVAGAGVRFGSPAPEPAPPRRAMSEHAEALGRIFEKAAARRETLRILAAGARRVAGARLGMPGTLTGPAFVARLRGLRSPGAADLADAMERAESGREAKDVQMAEAAANLARAKRRFLHGGE